MLVHLKMITVMQSENQTQDMIPVAESRPGDSPLTSTEHSHSASSESKTRIIVNDVASVNDPLLSPPHLQSDQPQLGSLQHFDLVGNTIDPAS